jgi:hypothetical protein
MQSKSEGPSDFQGRTSNSQHADPLATAQRIRPTLRVGHSFRRVRDPGGGIYAGLKGEYSNEGARVETANRRKSLHLRAGMGINEKEEMRTHVRVCRWLWRQ